MECTPSREALLSFIRSDMESIDDEVICFKGYTDKKDKDFVTEIDYNSRQKPQRDEAKEFILDFLKDGEKEVSELDEMAAAMSISKNALKNKMPHWYYQYQQGRV